MFRAISNPFRRLSQALRAIIPSAPNRPSGKPKTLLNVERFEDRTNPTTMTYHGGPLLQHVEVETVFVGSSWNSDPTLQQQSQVVDQFFQSVTDSPYVSMLSQYNVAGKSITGGHWTGRDVVAAPSASAISEAQIRSLIQTEQSAGRVHAEDGNRIYFVFTAPGIVITNAGGQTSASNFYGYHGNSASDSQYFFAAIPYQGNGNLSVSGLSPIEQLTAVSSHELVEAITDPAVNLPGASGWYENSTGNEIGDVPGAANVFGTVGGYKVQKVWSQVDNRSVVAGDRGVVAANFFASDEYLNRFVGGLYTNLLKRTGSASEISFWVSQIKTSHYTDEQVTGKFLATTEYANLHGGTSNNSAWISAVYVDLLGRTASASDIASWTNFLSTHNRETTGFTIARSQEAETRLVNGYYTTYLGRAADASGLAAQVNALVNGTATREQVQASMIASNEYVDRFGSTNEGFVDHLYLDVFGRAADAAGRTAQLNYLRQGGA